MTAAAGAEASLAELVYELTLRHRSVLLLGLDPAQDSVPEAEAHCHRMLEAGLENVCGVKVNLGFFLRHGAAGVALLERLRERIPQDRLYILDAKAGDISTSSAAYATAFYDALGADAVTVNPILGRDSVLPFLGPGRHVFLLARTSNPGAGDFLDASNEKEKLFERVVAVSQRWAGAGNIGYVVGATAAPAARRVRQLAPQAVLLMPGIGAQGGDLSTIGAALDARGAGVLVPVTRHLAEAEDPRQVSARLRDQLNALRPL